MILHPAIMALMIGSFLVLGMIVYAAGWGWRVIDGWDLKSGSERQLMLEKKTYLISTLMVYALSFQILSLFLLVYLADDLHRLFVGAMCAAGTLNVNEYGYPAVVLKGLNCVLAGVWLVMNHADSRAVDYPLIRRKYTLLLVLLPLVAVEVYYQTVYFLNLKANVITSCCGSLFSVDETGVGAGLAGLPIGPTAAVFGMVLGTALLAGVALPVAAQVGPGAGRERDLRPARFGGGADFLHRTLFLRAPDASLPLLSPATGVWVRRLCRLRDASARRDRRRRELGADTACRGGQSAA